MTTIEMAADAQSGMAGGGMTGAETARANGAGRFRRIMRRLAYGRTLSVLSSLDDRTLERAGIRREEIHAIARRVAGEA